MTVSVLQQIVELAVAASVPEVPTQRLQAVVERLDPSRHPIFVATHGNLSAMLVGELQEAKQLRVQSYVLACSARDRFVPELVRPQKVGPLLVEQPYVLTGAARDRYVPELVRQARSEQPEDSESRDLPAVSGSADRISTQIG